MSNKNRNGGEWTESRFQSFIKSALRSASQRWGPKFSALQDAFVDKRVNQKTGRIGKHYECASCRNIFPSSQVQVDHIEPVIPVSGFTSWDDAVERMFPEKEGFQVLCLDCHKIKTKTENEARRNYARATTEK